MNESDRQEALWLHGAIGAHEVQKRHGWTKFAQGVAMGFLVAPLVVLGLGAWWLLGLALAIMLTDVVLLTPWVQRRRDELHAPWAVQMGLRALCGGGDDAD